jgi:hypothetical protein
VEREARPLLGLELLLVDLLVQELLVLELLEESLVLVKVRHTL